VFWQLVCSHLIADFPLQSERMACGKLRHAPTRVHQQPPALAVDQKKVGRIDRQCGA
jgi:hypothetical protein